MPPEMGPPCRGGLRKPPSEGLPNHPPHASTPSKSSVEAFLYLDSHLAMRTPFEGPAGWKSAAVEALNSQT